MKEKNLKKIILMTIGFIFVIYNLIWLMSVIYTYGEYKVDLGHGVLSFDCAQQENGYTYAVKSPNYLSFTGNLSICQDITVYEDGSSEDSIDMLIWPMIGNTFMIGITISINTYDENEKSYYSDGKSFYVDEQMNLIDTGDAELNRIYEQNLGKIRKIFKLAYKKWGILPLD